MLPWERLTEFSFAGMLTGDPTEVRRHKPGIYSWFHSHASAGYGDRRGKSSTDIGRSSGAPGRERRKAGFGGDIGRGRGAA